MVKLKTKSWGDGALMICWWAWGLMKPHLPSCSCVWTFMWLVILGAAAQWLVEHRWARWAGVCVNCSDRDISQILHSLQLNGTWTFNCPLFVCVCVCISANSAQMGLIETTRGLLPGAGKTNRGHWNDPGLHWLYVNRDKAAVISWPWGGLSCRGQSASAADDRSHSGQRAHFHR